MEKFFSKRLLDLDGFNIEFRLIFKVEIVLFYKKLFRE